MEGMAITRITAEVSDLPGYTLSPTTLMFASPVSLMLSCASACCQGHGAPAVLSSTSLRSRVGELI